MSKWVYNKNLIGIRDEECVLVSEDIGHDSVMEQIVREHNAHDELVKALEAFVKNEGYDRKDIREMLVRNAESALQKAKGNE